MKGSTLPNFTAHYPLCDRISQVGPGLGTPILEGHQ